MFVYANFADFRVLLPHRQVLKASSVSQDFPFLFAFCFEARDVIVSYQNVRKLTNVTYTSKSDQVCFERKTTSDFEVLRSDLRGADLREDASDASLNLSALRDRIKKRRDLSDSKAEFLPFARMQPTFL